MTIKYSELPPDLQYTLRYSVVNFVLMNKKMTELKAKHFNHIPEDHNDYDEYKFCDREAYSFLNIIKKIKQFKGGKGYYGLTGLDMARKYSHANFKKFNDLIK
jgi:hypothetical protein